MRRLRVLVLMHSEFVPPDSIERVHARRKSMNGKPNTTS